MKKITFQILIVVAIAGLLGVAGTMFLAFQTSYVAQQYQELVDNSLKKEQYVSELRGDIYYVQYLVSNHVVTTDEVMYDAYEQAFYEKDEEIREELETFSALMEDGENQELIHRIAKSYYGFYSKAEIVISLDRGEMRQTAEYYICYDMADYIEEANGNLELLNQKISSEMNEATASLENSNRFLNWVKYFSISVVLVSSAVGAIIVARNAKKILVHQSDTERLHQMEVLKLQKHVIVGMANLIESRDGETGEHVKRTSDYVEMISKYLLSEGSYEQMDATYQENMVKAAPLHDIGKIKVPDSILQKPGKLTPEEFEIIKQHATKGGEIIYSIMRNIEEKEYLDIAHDVAMYHHEKWDGSGYPEGLKGENIPLCARIMAIADVFDALVSKRCYKEAFPFERAYEMIEESSGTHFDPQIVEVFVKLKPEIKRYLQLD